MREIGENQEKSLIGRRGRYLQSKFVGTIFVQAIAFFRRMVYNRV